MTDIRAKLKSIASSLIRQGGYSAFSFRDLADKVGVKSSSVHYYFPTKAALVEELTNDYKIAFFERLETGSAKLTSTSAKLLFLVKLYEESLSSNLNCLCGMLASEIELLSANERSALKGFYNQLEKWLKSTLPPKEIKIDMDVNEVVHLIMSSLNGALALDRAYDGKKRLSALKNFITIVV